MTTAEEILRKFKEIEQEISIVNKQRIEITNKLNNLKQEAKSLEEKYSLMKSKEASQVDWAKNEYKWSAKIKQILNDVFKLESFRHQQLAAINAILSQKDVILLMPTGGGKSLCYQLPSILTKGVTLVVSPLLSLIDDQIISLKNLGINSITINSTNSKTVSKEVYDLLSHGKGDIKMIYVTPEWLAKSKRFMSSLQKCYARKGLDRIAIDEVHCCSQWGHDFRPDYQYLHILKTVFPDVPIIGLTATATEKIIIDTQKMLGVQGCTVLKASYNRPNLYYEVRMKPSTDNQCLEVLEDLLSNRYKNQSGIIYTTTINDSIQLATELKNKGLRIACYHASLEPEIRYKVHMKWLSKQYQAIVATVAFGMGIDKPDVRFVIHHALPKSMENFYQESGRAGRDDKNAECILFYSLKDISKMSSMVSTTSNGLANLFKMVKYCIDPCACRRSIIATHFDEVWDSLHCNKMCDHCRYPKDSEIIDITKYADDVYKIIDHADSTETRLTAHKLIGCWFQTGGNKTSKSISKPMITKEFGEQILTYLLVEGYLKEDIHFTAYTTIIYIKRGHKSFEGDKVMMKVAKSRSSLNNSMKRMNHFYEENNPKKSNKC